MALFRKKETSDITPPKAKTRTTAPTGKVAAANCDCYAVNGMPANLCPTHMRSLG